MPRILLSVLVGLGMSMPAISLLHGAEPASPPPTAKKPVTDTYYGVKVVDDYRWLENAKDPAVARWTDAQSRYARSVLDRLPALTSLRQRLKKLYGATSPDYLALQHRGGV